MKNKYVFVCVMLLVILLGCMGLTVGYVSYTEGEDVSEDEVTIVTSFYPIYIACMNIVDGIDGVTLENLSEPQTGCLHDFQMTPEDLKLLSTAEIFVINGGGIESFMEEVAAQYPELAIVTATENLTLLAEDGAAGHDHGADGDSTDDTNDGGSAGDADADGTNSGSTDDAYSDSTDDADETDDGSTDDEDVNAHAWMSVAYYRVMVQTIAEGLAAQDSEHADEYLANASAYDDKLAELAAEQEELVQETEVPVILFHAAYAYVALDYNLEVVYLLDLDEERQVSAGEVASVLDEIREEGVTVILAEELYGSSMGATVQEESDVTVLYLDPMTRGEYDKDSYLTAMRQNIEILRGYLQQMEG